MLTIACKSENIDNVQHLINLGANLNKPNKLKNSPVKIAVLRKRIDILILFLENGAKPDTPKNVKSPLYELIDLFPENREIDIKVLR